MRISGWSSDVCSPDLAHAEARPVGIDVEAAQLLALHRAEADRPGQAGYRHLETLAVAAHGLDIALRAVAVHPALDLAVVVDLAAQHPHGTLLPRIEPLAVSRATAPAARAPPTAKTPAPRKGAEEGKNGEEREH